MHVEVDRSLSIWTAVGKNESGVSVCVCATPSNEEENQTN